MGNRQSKTPDLTPKLSPKLRADINMKPTIPEEVLGYYRRVCQEYALLKSGQANFRKSQRVMLNTIHEIKNLTNRATHANLEMYNREIEAAQDVQDLIRRLGDNFHIYLSETIRLYK